MKPRNCNGCLAFLYDGLRSRCDLSYPIKKTGEKYVPIVDETFLFSHLVNLVRNQKLIKNMREKSDIDYS